MLSGINPVCQRFAPPKNQASIRWRIRSCVYMICAHFHKGHLLVVIAEGEDGKMAHGSPSVEVQVI